MSSLKPSGRVYLTADVTVLIISILQISNLLKEHRVFRRLQLISFPVPCGLAGDLLKMSVTQSGITAIKVSSPTVPLQYGKCRYTIDLFSSLN